jgi:fatty-acyl-CoA synthase
LHEFCRLHLASYKTPRQWAYVEALPSTETGKLQKFKLLDALLNGSLVVEKT